jgi:D-3-phosphoglycerate dehydrogenase
MTRRVLVALGNYPTIEEKPKGLLSRVAQVEDAIGYLSEDDLVRRVKGVNAIILGAPRITRRVLEAADHLEVIARRGIGVDNIDVAAASEKGVVVTNCPDVLSQTVAEHALLLMLGISRRIVVADRAVRTGGWKEFDLTLTPEMSGKTLGIIGMGSIGSLLAQMVKTFAMKVLTNENPHLKPDRIRAAGATVVSLRELLAESDYVVLSLPLTTETKGMIGEKELAGMKRSAFLINISRGLIVDEPALYRALLDKKIAGAGLDVLATQPPEPENPILKLDNALFTPHCSGLTIETSLRLSNAVVDAITRLFRGEMPTAPVNTPFLGLDGHVLPQHGRIDDTGADGVDPDIVWSELPGQRPRERDYRSLG